jgi:hypothetical protein
MIGHPMIVRPRIGGEIAMITPARPGGGQVGKVPCFW